ncbi:MAG: RNA 2',3'-cyclic phosphodiesterase [Candidatus Omnitrophica bacterium]|nr:RNA 2',3'-cyclic phosphodiesterase [Candidatus Omnitrophota bacterium]
MRVFAAVEISQSSRDRIEGLIQKLDASGADVKWVAPQNLHLTLKFLGGISSAQARSFQRQLSETLASFKPFSLRLRGLGAFPSFQRPRIIWVGVDEGKEALIDLAAIVEKAGQTPGGAAQARPFEPHLTLGRVRSAKGLEKLVAGLSAAASFGCPDGIRVEAVTLFESVLSSAGPTYNALHQCKFFSTAQ